MLGLMGNTGNGIVAGFSPMACTDFVVVSGKSRNLARTRRLSLGRRPAIDDGLFYTPPKFYGQPQCN